MRLEKLNIVSGDIWGFATAGAGLWVEVRRAMIACCYQCEDDVALVEFFDWGHTVAVRYGPEPRDCWKGWVSDTHPWDISTEGWFEVVHPDLAAEFPAANQDVVSYLQNVGLEILHAKLEGREAVI